MAKSLTEHARHLLAYGRPADDFEAPPGDRRLPLSAVLAAIDEDLSEPGWFPRQFARHLPHDAAVLELRSDGLVLHTNREAAFGHYERSQQRVADRLEAVRTFVQFWFGEPLGGVSIDWES